MAQLKEHEKDKDETKENDGLISLDSEIICDENEIMNLSKVLSEKLGDKVLKDMKFTLLHRSKAEDDDDSKNQFHAKCDNKGRTLTIVHSEFDHIFCCYTNVSWSSEASGYMKDETAFVALLRSAFGHETPKIYIIDADKHGKMAARHKGKAVYHNAKYGPAFGSGQDVALDYYKESWVKANCSYLLNGNALCGGKAFEEGKKIKYKFKYKCYEVFSV